MEVAPQMVPVKATRKHSDSVNSSLRAASSHEMQDPRRRIGAGRLRLLSF